MRALLHLILLFKEIRNLQILFFKYNKDWQFVTPIYFIYLFSFNHSQDFIKLYFIATTASAQNFKASEFKIV